MLKRAPEALGFIGAQREGGGAGNAECRRAGCFAAGPVAPSPAAPTPAQSPALPAQQPAKNPDRLYNQTKFTRHMDKPNGPVFIIFTYVSGCPEQLHQLTHINQLS